MKKLVIAIASLVVIASIGVAGYAYINIRNTPEQAVQQTTAPKPAELKQPENTVLSSGNFTEIDAVHKGSGTAKIVKTPNGAVLQFENFSVTPGPDLFVYASPNPAAEGLGEYAVIGNLKSQAGDQVYNLPADYERYKSIVIWCRSFSVTFSTADLQAV